MSTKFDALKEMSREERAEYFKKNKSDLLGDVLSAVNGGTAKSLASGGKENPNSEECPYNGNWVSSFGYVCDGQRVC